MLGREIVDAASIAALTTAILVSGRREERWGFVPGRHGRTPRSRLATVSALAAVALVAAAGVVALFGPHRGRAAAVPLAATVPGESAGPAPWPAGVTGLRARLRALALPALGREGTALHVHEHLDVFVHGRRVAVPAGIGIGQGFISPLHTHDGSGIVHVESPDVRTFTLGEVFGVWGVRLTRRCLGGYCAHGADRLRVYADGRPVAGDPRVLPLAPHAELVVAFGTAAELPRPIPSSYRFPPGL
jgi:hypothetical protein